MSEAKRASVVVVGEVMIEIARSDGRTSLGCGGDTFNTAVYLARAGIPVAFATALGGGRKNGGTFSNRTAASHKANIAMV